MSELLDEHMLACEVCFSADDACEVGEELMGAELALDCTSAKADAGEEAEAVDEACADAPPAAPASTLTLVRGGRA